MTSSTSSTSVIVAPKFTQYSPEFQCPICMNDLGLSPGMIPAIITTCRPVAHVICLQCADKQFADNSKPRICPKCNSPCGDVVPMPDFVKEQRDPFAKHRLDQIRAAKAGSLRELLENSHSIISAAQVRAVKSVMDRITRRVTTIRNSANARLEAGDFGCHVMWWENYATILPVEPGLTFVPSNEKTRAEIARTLTEMVRELQPSLDALFSNTGVKIRMHADQSVKEGRSKKFVYLKHTYDGSEMLKLCGIDKAAVNSVVLWKETGQKRTAVKRKRRKQKDDDDEDDDDEDDEVLFIDDDNDEDDDNDGKDNAAAPQRVNNAVAQTN